MLDEKHTVKLALMLTEVRAGQRRLGKDKIFIHMQEVERKNNKGSMSICMPCSPAPQ